MNSQFTSYDLSSQQLVLDGPDDRMSSQDLLPILSDSQLTSLTNYDEWGYFQDPFSSSPSSISNTQLMMCHVNPATVMPKDTQELPTESQNDLSPLDLLKFSTPPASQDSQGSQDLFDDNDDLNEDSQKLSQESIIDSQDENGVPAITPWPGKYNFQFSLEKGTTRKFSYSTKHTKLYCLADHDIEFLFSYDFTNSGSDMSLRAFLRYTQSEYAAIPVDRCMNHVHKDAGQNGLAYHILQCTNVNDKKELLADHFKDPHTNRCYVKVPMGKLQPGCNTISKMFRFGCLNSCRTDKILKKASTTVVFELLKKDKIVGRIPFGVRVCSCPNRDFNRDEPEAKTGVPKNKKQTNKGSDKPSCSNAGKKKGRGPPQVEDEEDSVEIAAKKRRVSEQFKEAASAVLPESQDLLLSSSQESVDENDFQNPISYASKKEKLQRYYKMSKFVMSLGFHENSILRYMSGVTGRYVKDQYRLAQNILKNDKPPAQNAGSPDSGIGPRK